MQKYIGSFENFQGHECYKISDTKDMEAFFINVVSSSDIWIFTSSKGGLTAGRKNADGAIFPYETDDKLHSSFATGKKVIIKVGGNFWEPFEKSIIPKYKIIQNIYKSIYGCKVTFEEINDDLKIAFSYTLESSEKFGFIVTSRIENLSEKDVEIEVVDGLQNIIPYGVNSTLQATSSTLVDAYKSAESLEKKLGIFSLTTVINDTPEPVEMLKANIAWTTKKDAIIHFDERVFSDFYSGNICNEEANLYGKKCGFFISFKEKITAKNAISYSFALDSEYDIIKIKELLKFIKTSDFSALSDDIENGIFDIKKSVELADGVQKSDDKIAISHHFLNTLYNIMRGGIFENEYTFNYDNFIEFAKIRNVNVTKYETVLDKIKGAKDINEMKKIASQSKVLHRLAYEYMPLSFSRRHGDPSRPWNRFNINLKNEKGEKIYFYEGNWRDIFQNWEALGMSFPFYFENIIAKFVNASTINGYNPYRINFYEIDWEKPEPNNPFSGFGYWGDHQIIYLLRLLKAMKNHFPTGFKNFLRLDIFSYANVPYIIKDFKEILRDSKNTIIFDYERDKNIEKLCDKMGTDGKLLLKNNEVYTVTLAEKLFVPLLSKMSNLMLGGGIFMNTQRPEWNDANNAIVGIGLSMVTVYHINSYIDFLLENISDESDDFLFSTEVVEWINSITYKLKSLQGKYENSGKKLLDELGEIFSLYQKSVYENGFSGKTKISVQSLISSLNEFKKAIVYTIAFNENKVYTSYNLLKNDFTFSPMKTMLEGQTAIIGSGILPQDKIINLVKNMNEELLDSEYNFHYLYPLSMTTKFAEKNIVDEKIPVDDVIILKDIEGEKHFSSNITTIQKLEKALAHSNYSNDEQNAIKSEFERIFAHNSFTGRSQNMYKYEGIGCVYWHQNAKLVLAILEEVLSARKNDENAEKLYEIYKKIVSGFIYRKSPEEALAIPIEPYSHTSFNKKSEQPGMTGQVKESVLTRRLEYGVFVENGEINFDTWFIPKSDYSLTNHFEYTICSTPVICKKTDKKSLVLILANNEKIELDSYKIPQNFSKEIFQRSKKIAKICLEF